MHIFQRFKFFTQIVDLILSFVMKKIVLHLNLMQNTSILTSDLRLLDPTVPFSTTFSALFFSAMIGGDRLASGDTIGITVLFIYTMV